MPPNQPATAEPAARKGEAITPAALRKKGVPELTAEMMHSTTTTTATPASSHIPFLERNRFIKAVPYI